MVKKMQTMSILLSLVLLFNLTNSSTVFATDVLGPRQFTEQTEKLIFCTFEEGTTNVSYTPAN